MKNSITLLTSFVLVLLVTSFFLMSVWAAKDGNEISGEVLEGYRVLKVEEGQEDVEFTVYRGDYLKLRISKELVDAHLAIPTLDVTKKITADLETAPYFKMKKTGTFPFSIGTTSGLISVVEFDRAQYHVVTSEDALQLIKNISPLILDVRTRQEYAGGHLPDSILIPVQEIQRRYTELTEYRDENILIYCATGNRSTVAAKILIDNGFNRIYNLREGIHVWAGKGNPVVR